MRSQRRRRVCSGERCQDGEYCWKIGMSLPLVSKSTCSTIPLLNAINVEKLLKWVPSHQRKFCEASAHVSFSGWVSVFPKDEVYEAIGNLLNLDQGFKFAEELCRRAGVRTVAQAIEKRAQVAAREARLVERLSVDALQKRSRRWDATRRQLGCFG